jgi:hypothetical protein
MDAQDRLLLGSVTGFILAIAVLGAFSNPSLAPSEGQVIRVSPPPQEAALITQPKDVKSVNAPALAPVPEDPRPPPQPALPAPAVVSKEVVREVPKEVIKEVPKEIVRQPGAQQAAPVMAPEPEFVRPIFTVREQGVTDVVIPFVIAGLVGISISIFIKRKIEGTGKKQSGEG